MKVSDGTTQPFSAKLPIQTRSISATSAAPRRSYLEETIAAADGVFVAIIPERRMGLALKITDGAGRASEAAVAALGSPGEPRAAPGRPLATLGRRRFQGRRWATRARPWVDRLACAWLIRRFIDPRARFVWLADPAGQGLNFLKAEKGAPITALAMSPDATRVAWADEDGNAGVSDI